jgi:hypothetical protein
MARAFAKIAFTPNVQAAQVRMGSRDAYRTANWVMPKWSNSAPTKSSSSGLVTAFTRAP